MLSDPAKLIRGNLKKLGAKIASLKRYLSAHCVAIALVMAIVGIISVVGAWLYKFHGAFWSNDPRQWANFGNFLGGALAPLLAFASFIALWASLRLQRETTHKDNLRRDDLVYYDHAVRSLQRAYETFYANSEDGAPPADRLLWLNVARLIITATRAGDHIRTKSIRDMYEGECEWWRRKFYDYLKPYDLDSFSSDADYFQASELRPINGIEERSIKVIYDFMSWPAGREDPVETVPYFSDEDLEEMVIGRRGIREHVRRINRNENLD